MVASVLIFSILVTGPLSVNQKSKIFEEIHKIRNKILPSAFIIICQHRNISFYFIFFTAQKPTALFSLKWKDKEIFLRLEVYITLFPREWDRDRIGSQQKFLKPLIISWCLYSFILGSMDSFLLLHPSILPFIIWN